MRKYAVMVEGKTHILTDQSVMEIDDDTEQELQALIDGGAPHAEICDVILNYMGG